VSSLIDACADLGIRFALDDFGTGYSSLTYLKRLPVRTLKIDQSFVRDMLDDPDDLAILDGVLSLAGSFDRDAIAEGVETEPLGRMLIQLGCEVGQGYAIARPMPGSQVPVWQRHWRPFASWSRVHPLPPEDRHLLFGMVEHRHWVAGVVRALRGESVPSLQLTGPCTFGPRLEQWRRYYEQEYPAISVITSTHTRIHELADAMLNRYAESGGAPPDELSMSHLYAQRDTLLVQLESLINTITARR
jgi:hypothetical protein